MAQIFQGEKKKITSHSNNQNAYTRKHIYTTAVNEKPKTYLLEIPFSLVENDALLFSKANTCAAMRVVVSSAPPEVEDSFYEKRCDATLVHVSFDKRQKTKERE